MRPRRTRGAAMAIVLTALACAPPSAAAAADDEIVWLPGRSLAAIGFDVDDDGDHELVRLHAAATGGGIALDLWDVVDGRWAPIGATDAVRRDDATPDVEMSRAGRLLTWERDGEERVLVVTAHVPFDAQDDANCCLELAELSLGADGPELDPIPLSGYGAASVIQPIDVEGDGTDELLITTYTFATQGFSSRIDLARWEGPRLSGGRLTTSDGIYVGSAGDLDGVPGDDVLVVTDDGKTARWSWDGGDLVEERWSGDSTAFPIGIVDGDLLVSGELGLQRVRWPRGGRPETIATAPFGTFGSAFVASTGSDVAVIVPGSDFGLADARSVVLGPNLEFLGEVEIPDTEPLWTLAGEFGVPDGALFPYLGPFQLRPDELEVWQGGVVISAGGPDGYRTRSASPFAGLVPLAVVGPDDGWVVASPFNDQLPAGGPAFLYTDGEPDPDAPGMRLIPRDLPATVQDGTVELTVTGAIVTEAGDGRREMTASANGFEAHVTAPAGSVVIVIGAGTVAQVSAETSPIRIAPGPGEVKDDEPFARTVVVALPDGRYVLEHWSGRFLGGELEASATAETVPFGLTAVVTGTTMPGAVVSASGASVTADADGAFRIEVDAPIWPQDVRLAIADPIGRTTDVAVEVVGLVDYRGLPWMAIVIALVLAAGVVLYVRVPRARPSTEPPPPEAPTLEEIEV